MWLSAISPPVVRLRVLLPNAAMDQERAAIMDESQRAKIMAAMENPRPSIPAEIVFERLRKVAKLED